MENVLEQSRWASETVPPKAVLLAGDDTAGRTEAIATEGVDRVGQIDPSLFSAVAEPVVPHDGNPRVVTMEDSVPRTIYTRGRGQSSPGGFRTLKSHPSDIREALVAPTFGENGRSRRPRNCSGRSSPT